MTSKFLSDTELNSAYDLIDFIESRKPLSPKKRERLYRKHAKELYSKSFLEKSHGMLIGFRGMIKSLVEVESQEEHQNRKKDTDNDFELQIATIKDGVEFYYESGTYPPPYYAWRVAVLLRKAKEYELEHRFLTAWNVRWSDGIGKRYKDLQEREEKAKKLVEKGRQKDV